MGIEMEEWMEKVLLDLNGISRVAVIEGAYGVEHMLRNYVKMLKYHWNYGDKDVTAYLELFHLEMFLEYEKIKLGDGFQYEIDRETDTKSIIIPHDVLCMTASACIEELNSNALNPLQVTISAFGREKQKAVITIDFGGDFEFCELVNKLTQSQFPQYYDMEVKWKKWREEFGDESISVKAENRKYLKIQFEVIER